MKNIPLNFNHLRYFWVTAQEGSFTRAAERLSLSGRSIGKVCRVARTIADLAGERRAELPHTAEALQYRLSGFGAPG